MGVSTKYGQVTTEMGNIGALEPVFVFRAQDTLLPDVLEAYLALAQAANCPARHLEGIRDDLERVKAWQQANPTALPASEGYRPPTREVDPEAQLAQDAHLAAQRRETRGV